MMALVAGQIDMLVAQAPTVTPMLNAGRLRAIAVSAARRSPGLRVELRSEREKFPQEVEIFLVTMPTIVAFAADQSPHESRSAGSLHGESACRAFRHATLFIGRRYGSHFVPKRFQPLNVAADASAWANGAHRGNLPTAARFPRRRAIDRILLKRRHVPIPATQPASKHFRSSDASY